MGLVPGPVWDLQRVVEQAGLDAFSIELETDLLDGSYVALDAGGAAVVNGRAPTGHHFLCDKYSDEWILGVGGGERERLINAFAVHFDSSPLSCFAGSGRLALIEKLTAGYERVTTRAVINELEQGCAGFPPVRDALALPWIKPVTVNGLDELRLFAEYSRRLVAGERNVGDSAELRSNQFWTILMLETYARNILDCYKWTV
jgi:hypothetical protein